MKLPHLTIESQFFLFEAATEVVTALEGHASSEEIDEIYRLAEIGLPPIVSRDALAVMLGVNPGLIWSLEQKPEKYYRYFPIKKGKGERHIYAPRVALKVIQKWISFHLSKVYLPPKHVFGFVPGKSHLQAAAVHCGASWVFSVDIRDFFPSTSVLQVEKALRVIGYSTGSASLLAKFFCLSGGLAQGAPTSPVLSNIAFYDVDSVLLDISKAYECRLSRYADDIVFSGACEFPAGLPMAISQIFEGLDWKLAPEKTETAISPNRLKVHGLLVHGDRIRLTKGYRNRIRAYEHLLASGLVRDDDRRRIKGHLKYAQQVAEFITPPN
ncbi:reverse transcriptase family protein [Pararhizobium sp. YC-54]|uniref:reverse transcriptase family protein n=1 Tax=Pararhizobium sp. YC-54 TaxID=2986920 RepID=UPI0021F6E3A7|nr:reverse transcriptase family protein [Pararhizobium sp. YC-54]MCV9997586.1 reverse transcriptase family protein [Pararhizobium sp. YC-54]